ncbi:MAG: hypothetical protein N3H84_02775, partial [Candidatus Caldarchaeum sp.]|nr:hypothetical protein [Candidatus Caldarchaeum sp.]
PQDRYMLSVPANPIREKETAQLQLYLQIDGTASITSISGVELQTSADKSKANGTISNIPQNQFKTLTAFFESPDLLVYVLEEANILVDLETKTVTADLVFANLGNSAIASVDLKLGKTASVASARSGFVTLGTSWDGEKGILNVKLLQELQKNQKTRFQVVYASDAIFKRTADGIEVFPPNYVNASVSNYFLTIRTPPVSQISFSTEPWQLKVLDGDRREVTFKYTNIYVTSQQALTLRYVETFSIPVPAVLLVFIAFVAGFLVVRSVRTGKAGGEAAALKQFRRTYELEAENLMNEIEKFGLDDKQKKPLKNVDELLRPLKNTILEAKKNLKTPEAVQVCSAVEKAVDELSSTLQALNRLTEDYQSNRISRTVYRRIYKDYSRECRRILDSASKAFESFIPS